MKPGRRGRWSARTLVGRPDQALVRLLVRTT